jgi:hypothetical protein
MTPTNLHHLDPPPSPATAAVNERLARLERENVKLEHARRMIEWERSKRAEARKQ